MRCCAVGWLIIAVGSMQLGCWSREPLHERVARYASLEGAKNSDMEPLRAEVARIEAAGQTPLLLMVEPIPAETNAAVQLAGKFTDATRLKLYPRLESLTPHAKDDRFEFDEPTLANVNRVLKSVELLRNEISQVEQLSACQFEVPFDQGFNGKLRFVDDVSIACRLRLIECAPLLSEGKVAPAIDKLDAAMRWVDRLAEVPRVEARQQAANLRRECFKVLERIANLPRVQQADIEQMFALVRRSLDNWPSNQGPLIGDRALTMHAYETIRDGHLDQVMTNEERQQLKPTGTLSAIEAMTGPAIDYDELSYLQAMADLIEAAQRSHSESVRSIDQTLSRFDLDSGSAQGTPLASHLFLPGIGYVMLEFSRDRAMCEAWAIALAAAGQLDMPEYKANPATGVDYELDRPLGGIVVVRIGDDDLANPMARLPQ